MVVGPERQRDLSWKCPDLCVVAKSLLTKEPPSQKSTVPSPNQVFAVTPSRGAHHGLRPRRANLPQQPGHLLGKLNDRHMAPTSRSAPFSGDLTSTMLQHDFLHKDSCRSNSCDGDASKSQSRAAPKSPMSCLDLEALCEKPAERSPDTLSARRGEATKGRRRFVSHGSTPKLDADISLKPLAQLSICERKTSALEALSGDVLIQICDYVQERDIVRLSGISRAIFNERLWHQLHLSHYGKPSTACLECLPFARASRLQLQSDFPVHHTRLFAIRYHHRCIRSTPPSYDCYTSRVLFAAEALVREDRFLREDEIASRSWRANARRNQQTSRISMLRDLVLARRANTEERMAMVDMRSAVERHTYAPGCRPRAPHVPPPWQNGHGIRGKGRAKETARIATLTGVLRG